MKENIFDELTKAIATATSRRQALRRIGGILGGSALAGLFPGLARADTSDGCSNACTNFCTSVFGNDCQAANQCMSDAAHHTGLCYTCGPESPGGTKPICCPENSQGKCSSYNTATCCSGGKVCQNGTCVSPTTTTTAAPTTTTTTTAAPTTTTTTTTAAPTTTTTATPTTTTTLMTTLGPPPITRW